MYIIYVLISNLSKGAGFGQRVVISDLRPADGLPKSGHFTRRDNTTIPITIIISIGNNTFGRDLSRVDNIMYVYVNRMLFI